MNIYSQNYVKNRNMVKNIKTQDNKLSLTNTIFSQLKDPNKYTLFKATDDRQLEGFQFCLNIGTMCDVPGSSSASESRKRRKA